MQTNKKGFWEYAKQIAKLVAKQPAWIRVGEGISEEKRDVPIYACQCTICNFEFRCKDPEVARRLSIACSLQRTPKFKFQEGQVVRVFMVSGQDMRCGGLISYTEGEIKKLEIEPFTHRPWYHVGGCRVQEQEIVFTDFLLDRRDIVASQFLQRAIDSWKD